MSSSRLYNRYMDVSSFSGYFSINSDIETDTQIEEKQNYTLPVTSSQKTTNITTTTTQLNRSECCDVTQNVRLSKQKWFKLRALSFLYTSQRTSKSYSKSFVSFSRMVSKCSTLTSNLTKQCDFYDVSALSEQSSSFFNVLLQHYKDIIKNAYETLLCKDKNDSKNTTNVIKVLRKRLYRCLTTVLSIFSLGQRGQRKTTFTKHSIVSLLSCHSKFSNTTEHDTTATTTYHYFRNNPHEDEVMDYDSFSSQRMFVYSSGYNNNHHHHHHWTQQNIAAISSLPIVLRQKDAYNNDTFNFHRHKKKIYKQWMDYKHNFNHHSQISQYREKYNNNNPCRYYYKKNNNNFKKRQSFLYSISSLNSKYPYSSNNIFQHKNTIMIPNYNQHSYRGVIAAATTSHSIISQQSWKLKFKDNFYQSYVPYKHTCIKVTTIIPHQSLNNQKKLSFVQDTLSYKKYDHPSTIQQQQQQTHRWIRTASCCEKNKMERKHFLRNAYHLSRSTKKIIPVEYKSLTQNFKTFRSRNNNNKKISSSLLCDTQKKFHRSSFILSRNQPFSACYYLEDVILGQGTYGCVCRAIQKSTSILRAVKLIKKKRIYNAERLRMENNIIKTLDHPNIVKLIETFEDDNQIYMVLELCTGGELFDCILKNGYLSEAKTAVIMRQICSALCYCHNRGIAHRDLKPENFLFTNSESNLSLKLIDFGLAMQIQSPYTTMSTKAGTPFYIAPEVLNGKYTLKCDMWSCGIIMYILLCGYPPFFGNTDAEILNQVKRAKLNFPDDDWHDISTMAKDLIRKLLNPIPEDRYSAEAALRHPWFQIMHPCIDPSICLQLLHNIQKQWMTSFITFKQLTPFEKAALTAIAVNLNEEHIVGLREAFMVLDKDCNGTLTLDEIFEGIIMLEFPEIFEQVLQSFVTEGCEVNYTEFLAVSLHTQHITGDDSACRLAFSFFDLDENGKISPLEIAQFLKDCFGNEYFTLKKIKEMVQSADIDGDGEIDFEEFQLMMQALKR